MTAIADDPLAEIDRLRTRLIRLIQATEPRQLTRRPPSGKWSVLENVTHLLFAEQSHLGRHLPKPMPFSAARLPPQNMATQKQLRHVGGEQITDIEVVLAEWSRTHRAMRRHYAANRSPENDHRLRRNLRHLNAHIRVLERLLR